jgi:hypothetical protein
MGASCTSAAITVKSAIVAPGSTLTSDGIIRGERPAQLQNIQELQFGPIFATTKFTSHNANSGQDFIGTGVYLIANDRVYVVHFISTKELWNAFAPLADYISNNLLNDPHNLAGMQKTIDEASTASGIGYCTNMKIIANMHVGPHIEHWDPQCNQYD